MTCVCTLSQICQTKSNLAHGLSESFVHWCSHQISKYFNGFSKSFTDFHQIWYIRPLKRQRSNVSEVWRKSDTIRSDTFDLLERQWSNVSEVWRKSDTFDAVECIGGLTEVWYIRPLWIFERFSLILIIFSKIFIDFHGLLYDSH